MINVWLIAPSNIIRSLLISTQQITYFLWLKYQSSESVAGFFVQKDHYWPVMPDMYFYSFSIYIAITKYLIYHKLTFTYYVKVVHLHVFFSKAEQIARTWCTRTRPCWKTRTDIVIKNCTAFTFHYICMSTYW